MARFKMCAQCQAEYDDPLNRRFHAQRMLLELRAAGLAFECRRGWIEVADPVAECVDRLMAGDIMAIKGLADFI